MQRGGLNRGKATPTPAALTKWPKAPASFSAGEKVAWDEIGEGLVLLGTASRADLILARLVARTLARCEEALDEPELKVTNVSSLMRLAADLLSRLGLSPQARTTVSALATERPKKNDPMAEFDS